MKDACQPIDRLLFWAAATVGPWLPPGGQPGWRATPLPAVTAGNPRGSLAGWQPTTASDLAPVMSTPGQPVSGGHGHLMAPGRVSCRPNGEEGSEAGFPRWEGTGVDRHSGGGRPARLQEKSIFYFRYTRAAMSYEDTSESQAGTVALQSSPMITK